MIKNKKAVRRPDMSIIRDALASRTMITSLGVVRQFPDQPSHFDIETEEVPREILVDVELVPSGERVLCRLGFGTFGVYSIPAVDQEVAVLIPHDPQSLIKDELENHPIIVGILSTETPGDLVAGTVIVEAPDAAHVRASSVYLGEGADQAAMRGDQFQADLTTLLKALETFCTAVSAAPIVGPAATTLAGASSDFRTAMFSHISQAVKVK